MNEKRNGEHLTESEVFRWLVEGPMPGMEDHLQGCRLCQERLAQAAEPLAGLRASLVNWSESQSTPTIASAALGKTRAARPRDSWLPVASLAAATILLAAFLVGGEAFTPRSGNRDIATAPAIASDSALIDQVDAEVSEAVPDAMTPLADLVAWDSISAPSNSGKPVTRRKAAMKWNGRVLPNSH